MYSVFLSSNAKLAGIISVNLVSLNASYDFAVSTVVLNQLVPCDDVKSYNVCGFFNSFGYGSILYSDELKCVYNDES